MGLNGWILANIGWIAIVLAAVAVGALGLAGWLATRLAQTERRYAALMTGADGESIQHALEAHVRELRATSDCVGELDMMTRGLERSGRRHMQRTGFLRYNPFRDAGGDQSFSLALTDGEGNGFVISSLRSRDGTNVYGKPLVGWSSLYPLTEEEQQAIEKARQ